MLKPLIKSCFLPITAGFIRCQAINGRGAADAAAGADRDDADEDGPPFSKEQLQRYIRYARTITPAITDEGQVSRVYRAPATTSRNS